MNCEYHVHLSCSAAHPVQSLSLQSLHKPVTAADYYIRRKVDRKLVKAAGKVLQSLVCLYYVWAESFVIEMLTSVSAFPLDLTLISCTV